MGRETMNVGPEWSRPDRELVELVETEREARLASYAVVPRDIDEHAAIEARLREGGYRDRQIVEVVQNGVDATRGTPDGGRVKVLLTEDSLYVANNGTPITRGGVESLLHSHLSDKRDQAIGRFGLGFKSLLGISREIAILSRSVSLVFNEARSREAIGMRVRLREDQRVPVTRLAWTVDARDELLLDRTAEALARWAVTVVRARLMNTNARRRLASALAEFPREFVLFAGGRLTLELDSRDAPMRTFAATPEGDRIRLTEGETASTWRVLSRLVDVVDEEAREDAGDLHGRDRYSLTWAVPDEGRERGRFWAWFPLQEVAPVPGVLNAPWKTNDDRSNVLRGAFNDALMAEMASLIVDSLPSFSTSSDPAATIDYLPRRDVGSDAATRLADSVWTKAARVPLVPDCLGTLRRASEVRLHPDVSVQVADLWSQLVGPRHRAVYVHPSTLRRERARRVRELVGTEPDPSTLTSWVELAAAPGVAGSTAALGLVDELNKGRQSAADRAAVRQAKIVLSVTGELVSAATACVAPSGALPAGLFAVHPDLLGDITARRVLVEVLGIQEVSADQWVKALTAQFDSMFRDKYGYGSKEPDSQDWARLWSSMRQSPKRAVLEFLTGRKLERPVRVRTVDGRWQIPVLVLRVGALVPEEESRIRENASWVLDEYYHEQDGAVVDALQIRDVPHLRMHVSWMADRQPWPAYATHTLNTYRAKLSREQRPQENYLRVLKPDHAPAPLVLIAKGSATVRARITRWLLDRLDSPMRPAEYGHETRAEAYPRISVPHPLSWLLEKHGLIDVRGRHLALGDLLPFIERRWARELFGEGLMGKLRAVVAGYPGESGPEVEDTDALWPILFELALDPSLDARARCELYETAAALGHVPTRVRAGGRELATADCLVAEAAAFGPASPPADLPMLVMNGETCQAFVAAGARSADSYAPPVYLPAEDPLSSEEFEPLLARLLAPGAPPGLQFQRVTGLHRTLGDHLVRLDVHRRGDLILVDVDSMEALDANERGGGFHRVCRVLADQGWLTVSPGEAKGRFINDATPRRRKAVATSGTDLATRLVAAVGGKVTELRQTLAPEVVLLLNDANASARQVASVVLTTHGPNALRELGSALERQGLQPPSRWGTAAAGAFAEAIGFPRAYGGSSEYRRDPSVDVEGPIPLGPLHDFQEEVRDELLPTLLGTGRRRALVNLPTGAGKTRVAVQTLVEVMRDGRVPSPILWIAQSDELCEQAVTCFREVWANYGAPRTQLRISRLWGGISRTVDHNSGHHVVVASIQTLVNRFESDGARWLADAGAVVIDEAHHAITKSYTALLRWLDRPDRRDDPPIIGLTATAFRGYNEDETERLARRFDERLVPAGRDPESLLLLLQERGVLARVRLKTLESRVVVDFTDEEQLHIDRFKEIPDSALERLARDRSRNDLILESILGSPAKTRFLVFALSVRHARTLAADLTLRGMTAASIDAGTAPGTRRHLISAFRNGSVPVLVNYGVLTTGFDAPMTDVILIARPTFSPNLYQQMIGRGLRGPENGGKAVCDLISVEDNFGRFGAQLAFHHFREMFRRSSI